MGEVFADFLHILFKLTWILFLLTVIWYAGNCIAIMIDANTLCMQVTQEVTKENTISAEAKDKIVRRIRDINSSTPLNANRANPTFRGIQQIDVVYAPVTETSLIPLQTTIRYSGMGANHRVQSGTPILVVVRYVYPRFSFVNLNRANQLTVGGLEGFQGETSDTEVLMGADGETTNPVALAYSEQLGRRVLKVSRCTIGMKYYPDLKGGDL